MSGQYVTTPSRWERFLGELLTYFLNIQRYVLFKCCIAYRIERKRERVRERERERAIKRESERERVRERVREREREITRQTGIATVSERRMRKIRRKRERFRYVYWWSFSFCLLLFGSSLRKIRFCDNDAPILYTVIIIINSNNVHS